MRLRLSRIGLLFAALLAGSFAGALAARAADFTQYVSPDFCALIVIHPDRIGKSTLAEAIKSGLPKEMTDGDLSTMVKNVTKNAKRLPPGFDADKLASLVKDKTVHRVVIMVEAMSAAKKATQRTPNVGIVVEFNEDVDGEGILSAVSTEWKAASADGTSYKTLEVGANAANLAALAVDRRMLIVGAEPTVVKMLAKEQGERPILAQLKKTGLDNDVIVEITAAPLWSAMTKGTGKTIDELLADAPDPIFGTLGKDVKSVSLKLNFSGKTLLHSEVATGKEETASALATMGQQRLDASKKEYEEFKKNPPPGIAGLIVPMVSKVGDEALAGTKIESSGTQVTIEIAMPDSLEGTLKALAQMGAAFLPKKAHPAPGGE